jgi:Tol biopolymer transport system component
VPEAFGQLSKHDWGIVDAQWSPDGARIASEGGDGILRVSDAATKQELQKIESADLAGYFDWSPDGKQIVATFLNGKAGIWDVSTGQIITDPMLRSEGNFIHSSGWSFDGSRIASASYPDYVTVIWNPQTTQIITTVGDGKCFMHYPNWSPVKNKFVTGCVFSADTKDNTPATIWDANGNRIRDLPSSNGESVRGEWSPDGKRIAVGYEDGTAKIWDAATGQELVKMAAANGVWIWHVTWSPDGTRVASADANGVIEVWDAATGTEVMNYQAPNTVFSLDWSPDGKYLISAGASARPLITRVWQSTDELIQYAKDCCVFRELTAAEREQFGLAVK